MRPLYLRISITSRCNLHCRYCRTAGSCRRVDAEPPEFSPAELRLLVECAAAEGVAKVRLTGGEPLMRKDLEEIAKAVSGVHDIRETVLTTNGIGLERRAEGLRKAGINRVNISLDTLRPERFRAITGHDLLPQALAGIEAARAVFSDVKLNTVPLRGVNDDEIADLVRFAGERGLWLRFIERYGSEGAAQSDDEFMHGDDVKGVIEAAFGPLRLVASDSLSVEETYEVASENATRVGLITSATHPPCSDCAKLRFTSHGQLRGCLFSGSGPDLAVLLRSGDAQAVRKAIREAFAAKDRCGPSTGGAVPGSVHRVGG